MMGFPEGWTAGMRRRPALAALGNAVVPHVAFVVGSLVRRALEEEPRP